MLFTRLAGLTRACTERRGTSVLVWSLCGLVGLLAAAPAASADAAWPPANATWTQSFITEPDGTALHADVLRPTGAGPTPVILSIGPYFNHSGQTGPAGPVEGTSYDPVGADGPEPSNRFQDFVDGADVIGRGYTYVMVDLRGFGGSNGCLDWAGPGEQSDVKAAVQWAASQPWSSGAVGMYGKSYDAVTGLIGEALEPAGLKAIVSQEPVYDMYRYLYTNSVRYENSLATPALYDAIAATPGPATDDPQYNLDAINDTERPGCPVQNYLDQAANSDPNSSYWQARNFIAASRGNTVPLFLTQGFLENNTKPDGAWDFFNELAGPKQAWFGMWDHIRGNDVSEGDNAAPRPWFDQVMNFYDHYLKGLTVPAAPPVSVETSDSTGTQSYWRSEQTWPPADAIGYTSSLMAGSYVDNALNAGSSEGNSPAVSPMGQGVWTISPPLQSDAHLAGVPTVTLNVNSTLPNANLSVDVYDIDAHNSALLLSRTAYLLPAGTSHISPEMYGDDWVIPAGHRIGVLVTTANSEWWSPTPSMSTVSLLSGTITLPFLSHVRTANLSGYKRPARLDQWLQDALFSVGQATIASSTSPGFQLPPPQTP